MTARALLVALLVVLLGAASAAGWFAARRRVISSWGGTFDCSLRAGSSVLTQGWMLGIGRYDGGAFEWYRLFSLSLRPRERVARRGLRVVRRRAPTRAELPALQNGALVVECRELGRSIELAMTRSALTGFLAWMEAAPPGQHTNVA